MALTQAAVQPPPAEPPPAAPTDPTVELEQSIAALAAESEAPVPKVKEAWVAYQAAQELAKPEAEGGIGHVPAPEQIKEYYNGALSFNAMVADLQTGNVENFVREVSRWAPEVEGALREKFGTPTPEVAGQIERKGQEALLQRMWQDIQNESRPEIKQDWTNAAQKLHLYLTGQKMPPTGPNFAPPEEAPEVKRLREENQKFKMESTQAAVGAWERAYGSGIQGVLMEVVEGSLAPWRNADGTPKVAPLAYQGLKRAMLDEVTAGLKANPYVTQQLTVLQGQARAKVAQDPAVGHGLLEKAVGLVKVAAGPLALKARLGLTQRGQATPALAGAVTPAPVPPRTPAVPAAGAAGTAPVVPQIPQRQKGQSTMDYLTQALTVAAQNRMTR